MRKNINKKILFSMMIVLITVSSSSIFAQNKNISGSYKVTGSNPNGKRYKGFCSVTRISGNRYRFSWIVGSSYQGTGTLRGNRISVNWGAKFPVIYKLKLDGRLKGVWANGRGSETLTPSASEGTDTSPL